MREETKDEQNFGDNDDEDVFSEAICLTKNRKRYSTQSSINKSSAKSPPRSSLDHHDHPFKLSTLSNVGVLTASETSTTTNVQSSATANKMTSISVNVVD